LAGIPPNPDSSFVSCLLAWDTFFVEGFAFEADACDFALLLFEAAAELLADAA